MNRCRTIALAAAPVVVVAILSAPLAHAARAGLAGVPSTGVNATIGHIAYITVNQQVKTATVHADGATDVSSLGPITVVPSGQTVQVYDLTASGDGKWLAWQEQVMMHNGDFGKSVLVLRHLSTGQAFHLNTEQAPVGFASGDRLITSRDSSIKTLDLTPTAHLVTLHDSKNAEAFAAYHNGVVDLNVPFAPHSKNLNEVLRLTSFGAKHTSLHRYVIKGEEAGPDAGWASGDSKHVVIERGDHTDFGGVGPSSHADEYALTGSHHRRQLGHYGTAKAEWRMLGVSFDGPSDAISAVWVRTSQNDASAESVVARYLHGKWRLVLPHAIAVAGNEAGYIIVQPGKWVTAPPSVADEGFVDKPTSEALLIYKGSPVPLTAEGTSFVWVAAAG